MPDNLAMEIFDWVGTSFILAAYALNILGVMRRGYLYAYLNLFGAAFLAGHLIDKGSVQGFILELVWALIAFIALGRLIAKAPPKSS